MYVFVLYLNAEFQRISRRDNKASFSDQCKEIEKNNRMGKTSDLFKKIRDIKGTFHAKMGTIKDRNGMDLKKAEDIKKTCGKNTQKNYTKKIFMTQITMMVCVITHLDTARHPGMQSQVGLRKHYYKQKLVKVMEFQLSYFKS